MVNPCELQFRLLATRRYMLDKELTIPSSYREQWHDPVFRIR